MKYDESWTSYSDLSHPPVVIYNNFHIKNKQFYMRIEIEFFCLSFVLFWWRTKDLLDTVPSRTFYIIHIINIQRIFHYYEQYPNDDDHHRMNKIKKKYNYLARLFISFGRVTFDQEYFETYFSIHSYFSIY